MKPILFNTEMVRAIMEGRKTVTRRIAKYKGFNIADMTPNSKAPYKPGDILYVRETWTQEGAQYFYREDIGSDFLSPCETLGGGYPRDCMNFAGCEGCTRTGQRIHWRPSIHMPKEAARIFLRVTDVYMQRLREIDAEQAVAEGAVKHPHYVTYGGERCLAIHHARYLKDFISVWESTIKPADLPRYGWDANPWVWVIEFERIDRPEVVDVCRQ